MQLHGIELQSPLHTLQTLSQFCNCFCRFSFHLPFWLNSFCQWGSSTFHFAPELVTPSLSLSCFFGCFEQLGFCGNLKNICFMVFDWWTDTTLVEIFTKVWIHQGYGFYALRTLICLLEEYWLWFSFFMDGICWTWIMSFCTI